MEFHIQCDPDEIARYVFCPGSYDRAQQIAEQFDDHRLVSESRGYRVYSGTVDGVFMTACGTGMGGPTVAIALEELAHMGADTFIRVGSCGVLQPGQGPGDIIIASGAYRAGGTGSNYLPPSFPAVPTFEVTRALVESAEQLDIPTSVGITLSGDAFYAPRQTELVQTLINSGVLSIEMESDTLFVVGAYRGWRTGALFASDGAPGEVKPDWGIDAFLRGQAGTIKIAIRAMLALAHADTQAKTTA